VITTHFPASDGSERKSAAASGNVIVQYPLSCKYFICSAKLIGDVSVAKYGWLEPLESAEMAWYIKIGMRNPLRASPSRRSGRTT
jgi:hypothetical protein